VATVIVLPALLLSFWLVVQFAIAAHVRHVALAAAQDAALAAASGGDYRQAAQNDLAAVASMTSGVEVSAPTGVEHKVVTVHAEVLQVFPIGRFDVTVSAAAPVERFVPQPERP
jgi:Flp pilus assembly protein TadG